jgi:hypothetical protein
VNASPCRRDNRHGSDGIDRIDAANVVVLLHAIAPLRQRPGRPRRDFAR